MSHEIIKSPATSDNSLASLLNWLIGFRLWIEFDGQYLKQEESVVNIYIVYEINFWPFKQSADFTLEDSLFGAVKLTKNADFDKYKYFFILFLNQFFSF